MEGTARLLHRPFRHERDGDLVERRDLLDPIFVNDVPVRHLEGVCVAQVDLLLTEAPLPLAVLHRDRRRFHAIADLAIEPLRLAALEDVVVLDISAVRLEVAIALARRALVGVLEEVELELRRRARVEAELARTVDLPAQHLAR